MEQYLVTGMSCAACSTRVEKAVSNVPGVDSVSVSLLTNSMGVSGKASSEEIIKAVEAAGYGAKLKKDAVKPGASKISETEEMLKDRETPKLKKRLITSICFLIVLLYVSMGHMMWDFPLPFGLGENPAAIGIIQLVLAAIVIVINRKFFINGFKGIIHKAPNMDTLVALGASASFVYSVVSLVNIIIEQNQGQMEAAMALMDNFYFESAAMILTLITVGKTLEAYSKGKTTDALKSLLKLAPKTATIIKDEVEKEVPLEEVEKGDIFVVRPGENIPIDGVVIEGESAVDESALTGESIPADKTEGSKVFQATLNQSGFIKCRSERVGEDTTFSQIIKLVSDAAATKAPAQKTADKVSGIFVPVVILIAIITLIIWLLIGENFGYAISRAVSVLVISCPCSLGLATPVAIMVGNGKGAKNGILFKTAASLEEIGKIQIAAFDKTGTITKGEPQVTDVVTGEKFTEEELLLSALSLESKSEHPLAKAIISYALDQGFKEKETTGFKSVSGNGLKAYLGEKLICGGNQKFIQNTAGVKLESRITETAEKLAGEGKTPMFFSCGDEFLGIIAVADVIKEDSKEAIKELKDMGIHVVMLTGDNVKTAEAIAREVGVDEVVAGVLPKDKERIIRALKERGKTAMTGDGINDAPALARADLGIAIGAGTDVAIDAAEVVLMKSSIKDVCAAVRLGRATLRDIRQNLFWAFIYNCIGIPFAAGVFVGLLGWSLNPMIAAACMSLSSFCVVMNALRLNLFNVHDNKKDRRVKNAIPDSEKIITEEIYKVEDKVMTKTIKLEGMMCGHCEMTVKKALEALDGVESAEVSHEKGTAVVTLTEDIADDVFKKTVEDKDYTFISVE